MQGVVVKYLCLLNNHFFMFIAKSYCMIHSFVTEKEVKKGLSFMVVKAANQFVYFCKAKQFF